MLQTTDRGRLGRTLMTAYGAAAYAVFFAVFLYSIGWVEGLVVPRTIDEGPQTPIVVAVMVNLALLSVFAVQHSVMARPWFKDRWTRIVPQPIERSTFVLFATAALALVMWQWHPLPQEIWDVDATPVRVVLYAVSFAGWGLVLASTFAIDHFDLFGLRQVLRNFAGKPPVEVVFRTPMLYRVVRHPLYLGFLIAFWVAPTMSVGHLLFAAVTTGYILVALRFEEHDLTDTFGDRYRDYSARVPRLVPRPRAASRT
ncbi:methanethiol S-methyltransferase [Rhodococcus aetherivorans]